jgi:hypothetical protein
MQERDRTASGMTTVVGTFDERSRAEHAIERLRDAGYDRERVGFAAPEGDEKTVLVEDHGNAAAPGAVGGLVTGAAAGGALAWIGLVALPVIGPFVAGGALGTALIGAAAGGVGGGILGGLLGFGIPRHRAEYHEEQLRSGRSLVVVDTTDADATAGLLRDAGAASVDIEPRDERVAVPVEAEAREEEPVTRR